MHKVTFTLQGSPVAAVNTTMASLLFTEHPTTRDVPLKETPEPVYTANSRSAKAA